ncbi:MAG: lipoate--protein ligase [Bacteroidales bacterium]|nr:lipoate--protein ligase [Bacteroidales bacterium]
MRFVLNDSTDPCYNMAFDDFCLKRIETDDPFFCLWRDSPSVIIGLNQNASAEVNLQYLAERGIVLARRETGGGAVYHDLQNLNYSFWRPVSEGHGENGTDAVNLIVDALNSMGVKAEQGGRNDIFVDGLKVSGFARRVYKNRELIHGTLMYDVDIDTLTRALDVPGSKLERKGVASVRSRVANLKNLLPDYPSIESFRDALQEILAHGDSEIELTEEQTKAVRRLADSKFSTPEWIYGRVRDAGSDAL